MADICDEEALRPSETVAVIGAGTMGSGIALVAARAGHPVLLYDADAAAVTGAKDRLRNSLDHDVKRGKLSTPERDAQLARIVAAPDIEALSSAKLVIEAIVEDFNLKSDVLRRIEAVVKADAILATNTSSLSVTALAARMARPERVVGMHFFNPAPVLPLVEVASAHLTSPAVARTIFATALAWGKTPVSCGSTPGFIVNRVARPFYGEALRLLLEGAAHPSDTDAVFRESGGFRMGPFELMDFIGHDVNYAVTSCIYNAFFQDPRYRPSLVQKELVDANLLGRKSGRGFYNYALDASKPRPTDAPHGPRPTRVVAEGDLGPASALTNLAREAGIAVELRDGPPLIRIDGAALALSDGRTATERSVLAGEAIAVFDLAFDYKRATRIACAVPAGVDSARVAGFFQALHKNVSILDDTPGLAIMRTVAMLVNEAADAVHQGVASVADIDNAMLKAMNYPCGPLAWGDALGAPRIVAVMDALARWYGAERYRTSPMLRRQAMAGEAFRPRE